MAWFGIPYPAKFGWMSSSAFHDRSQQWSFACVFTKILQRGLADYVELQVIAWIWQAADSTTIEAPLARESTANQTDVEKRLKTTHSHRRK
tara:strand:+ start:233 stop:505 length:273 start_codon:yes stop_codon:yes gene_type:complete